MKGNFQFPPVFAINERWNGSLIRQLLRPGYKAEVSLTEYTTAFFRAGRRQQVKGYLLADGDGTSDRTLAVVDGNYPPDEFEKILRLNTAASEVGGTLPVDSLKATWLRHPGMVQASEAAVDYEGRIEATIESWRGAFSYVREDGARPGLRPPQIEAVHAVHAHWAYDDEEKEAATIVLPTGTGKTETMLSVLVSHPCQKLLVVVPTDPLRTQIANKFLTLGVLKDFGILKPECLYPIVGVLNRKPLSTEDVDYVFAKCQVVVTTMQIAGQCADEVQERMAHHCPYLFIDEAHHVGARTWKKFKKKFAARRILQFTATPFREDDEPVEGKVIARYSLSRAQKDGYFRKITFKPVREFDPGKADEAIAAAAVEQLREDEKRGHILMARVGNVDKAEKVFPIYERYAEFNPVRIDSGVDKALRELNRKKLLSGQSKIVVCVNMLGEGFDLPELKIAAFHDVRKSPAVTLQLAGRFTRARIDLGHATFIANVGDVRVREDLRKLYTRDPDWNDLLPQISEEILQEQAELSELIEGFKNFPKDMPLQHMRPAVSTVIYKTKCKNWTPEEFRRGIPGINSFEKVVSDVNYQADSLIIVTARKVPVEWLQLEDVFHLGWELYILFWDRGQNLLFIHTSSNDGQYKRLARAVAGDDVELVEGPPLFRCFSGINRLRLKHVGLNEHLGQLTRFTGRMGSNIEPTLTEVQKRNASKSVVAGAGYEGGRKTTLGCSANGRIWSQRRTTNLNVLAKWCRSIGKKVLDESLDPDEVLRNTLRTRLVSERPRKMPIGIDWPDKIYLGYETVFTFVVEGYPEWPLYKTDINLIAPDEDGDIRFAISSGRAGAEFTLTVFREGDVKDFRVSAAGGRKVLIRHGPNTSRLEDFFYENPPVVWFADGSSLKGNCFTELNRNLSPYPKDRVEAWDWRGVNIRKESQGMNRDTDSIQFRVIEELKKRDYDVIIDDDDSGEAADVVTIKVEERPTREKFICVEFYHCKFSLKDTPGARIKDLYEVCGQAQKSIHWMEEPTELFAHLLRREPRREKGREMSRFEKGGQDEIFEIMEMSRVYAVEMKIFIVQPGMSRAGATPDQLELLSVTENHLMETYQLPFGVIASR